MQNITSNLKIFFLSLLVMSVIQSGAVVASGTTTKWQGTDESAVRLIAGPSDNGRPDRTWLGVQIKLGLGWKTYWRNPGESGAPPLFNWENSENLAAAKIHWPAPRRFEAFGYSGFGYHNQVVIPILLIPLIKHRPITARLKLNYMICAKICIPKQVELSLKLIEPAPGGVTASLVKQYLGLVPKQKKFSELSITSVNVSGDTGEQILHVRGHSERQFRAPDLMVEGPNPFAFGRPNVALSNDQKIVAMEVPVYTGTSKIKLTDQVLTLTMVDGKRALQQRLKVGR